MNHEHNIRNASSIGLEWFIIIYGQDNSIIIYLKYFDESNYMTLRFTSFIMSHCWLKVVLCPEFLNDTIHNLYSPMIINLVEYRPCNMMGTNLSILDRCCCSSTMKYDTCGVSMITTLPDLCILDYDIKNKVVTSLCRF